MVNQILRYAAAAWRREFGEKMKTLRDVKHAIAVQCTVYSCTPNLYFFLFFAITPSPCFFVFQALLLKIPQSDKIII